MESGNTSSSGYPYSKDWVAVADAVHSELAGLENFMLLADGEGAPQVYNLATAESDYATADTYFFEEVSTEQTGAVSHLTGDELTVTIQFEAVWTFVGLTLNFGIIYPHSVTIAEYKDGSLSETHDYDVDKTNFYLHHEFFEVDKIVITFHANENQRVHLNSVLIGSVTDYEITEHDMMQFPTATQTERVKSVNVKYYEFAEGGKAVSATANAEAGENLVTFDKPCYGYAVEGVTITDSGAYHVVPYIRC